MDPKTKLPSQDPSANAPLSIHPNPFPDVDYGPERIGIEIVLERPVPLETPVPSETDEWFDLVVVMRLLEELGAY